MYKLKETQKEFLDLIDNNKLLKLVKKCISESKELGFKIFVKEYQNTSYDVEIEQDFDYNMLSILIDGKWEDKNMIPEMEKLLTNWNWENIKLSDGSILIITEDNKFNRVINILTDCELVDGIITYRHWIAD